jgi:tRNA(Arg) A34 adenosine deaminase TadA
MSNQQFMLQAIEAAKQSTQPIKCGCVLVKDGKVLAATFNSQRQDDNPIAHAEIKALLAASEKVGRKGIKDSIAYCTCEPCIMCLSALNTAGITELYFGISMSEAFPKENQISLDIDTFLKATPWKLTYHKHFLINECLSQLYHSNQEG